MPSKLTRSISAIKGESFPSCRANLLLFLQEILDFVLTSLRYMRCYISRDEGTVLGVTLLLGY